MEKIILFFVKRLKLTGTFYGNYYQDGKLPFGLTKIDNNYYFYKKDHSRLTNIEQYIEPSLTNNLLKPAIYKFDSSGKITNPDDPRFPGGIPSKADLAKKLEEVHATLKASRQKSSYKKNNHHKLTKAQITQAEDYAEVLEKLWVRKEPMDKLNYLAMQYFKRAYNKKDLVNYIRHQCSNYDVYLSKWQDYSSDQATYHYILKKNVLILIGNVYDNLATTCTQMIKELNK